MKPESWMLSIEGEVLMGPHTGFMSGLACLVASYYAFGMQYPDGAACTLEFIQRYYFYQTNIS